MMVMAIDSREQRTESREQRAEDRAHLSLSAARIGLKRGVVDTGWDAGGLRQHMK
jgi:hypothetical protein